MDRATEYLKNLTQQMTRGEADFTNAIKREPVAKQATTDTITQERRGTQEHARRRSQQSRSIPGGCEGREITMSIDKALKTWKQARKESDATLEELEARAGRFAGMQDARRAADKNFESVQAELDSVAFERDRVKGELHEATILQDPRAEPLRDRYIELSDREQELREHLGDATRTIEANTPDAGDVAELTTRLKRFSSPDAGDVVKAIQTHAEQHADATGSRIAAALAQLPTPDPRSTHRALMAADEHYRTGEGATLDGYLADEDDAGRGEQATAVLASRLEARDRRAVIAAR